MEMKSALDIGMLSRSLLDLLFPMKCPGCETRNEIFCDSCIDKINLNTRETANNIFALFDYQDPVIKKVIWKLKYHHHRYLGRKLGELLYNSFIEDISGMKILTSRSILIIPVPISKKKTKFRWYNQAEIIAKGFCKQSSKKILELRNDIVFKKFETTPQAKIHNKTKRLKNIKNVFGIKNPEFLKGRIIIVIDDVTTTGGTITEIIKILKKSGARKVIGLAVAH